MTLLPAPDNMNLLKRLISDDGKIEMGLHPVVYGWRVRAGFIGNGWVEIDWCCGDRPTIVWGTYLLLRDLLQAGHKLRDLPGMSKVKPWINDPTFVKHILSLGIRLQTDPSDIPELWELRNTYYTKYLPI